MCIRDRSNADELANGLDPNFRQILLGDVNLDGVVNFADIPPFIELLISGEIQAEADTNEDGVVSFADIPPFIELLISASS